MARRRTGPGRRLMRIGIDARELSGKPTGVGRYLGGLLREWTAPDAAHGHEFVLYSHRPRGMARPDAASVRQVPGAGGTLWEQRTLAGALAADAHRRPVLPGLLHAALHAASRASSRFTTSRSPRIRSGSAGAKGCGAACWPGGRQPRRRPSSRFRSSRSRRSSTRFGTRAVEDPRDPAGHRCARRVAAAAASASDGAHVLYVGSIFNRRHVPELIAAFTQVAARHPDAALHLVGDNRSHPHEDVRGLSPPARRPRAFTGIATFRMTQLRQLYRQARAFVFLSEYEGLGLTPLEALAAGDPVAAARHACGARELRRRGALRASSASVDAVAAGLERLLYDEPTRRTLLAAAPATLARYDWPTAARETLRGARGRRGDGPLHHHRELQRASRPRALPRRRCGSTRRPLPRGHRRRQRVDRRQRRRRGGVRRRARHRSAHERAGSRPPTTSASGRAREPNLLLLNSDTIVPPGAIDRLLERLAREPDVAVIGPRLVDGHGRAELSFGADDHAAQRVAPAAAGPRPRGERPDVVAQVEAMTRQEQRPDWVTGACLLVRRADAEAVGLLDERYFMYTEDVDFCASIRARGRQVLFTPDVEIVHLRGRSAASASSATRGLRAQPPRLLPQAPSLLAPFLGLPTPAGRMAAAAAPG